MHGARIVGEGGGKLVIGGDVFVFPATKDKAQLAVQEYKRRGGGYEGAKTKDNHLRHWQEEEWGTKSGRRSRDTGERYLSTPLFEPFGADMNDEELAISRSTPGYQMS